MWLAVALIYGGGSLLTLPLRLATLLGFFMALLGSGILIFVFGNYVLRGSIPGFPFLACIITIFAGAQLLALGVISFGIFNATSLTLAERSREIALLRAYAKYLRQTGIPFTVGNGTARSNTGGTDRPNQIGDPEQDLSRDDRDSAPDMPKCVVVDPAFSWGNDVPPAIPWHISTKSDSRRGSTFIASGSPNRALNSMILGP